MNKKITLTIFTISLIALIILLVQTNPTNLTSTVLLVPFALLFLIIWTGTSAALRFFVAMDPKRATKLSLIVAALPSGLLLLQSIGQLGPWDVATVAALAAIAYFYVAKLASQKQ